MSIEAREVIEAVLVGLGATLVIDLWGLFLKRRFRIPSLNFCLLGRWVLHMPSGTFRHASIGAASEKRQECVVGWMAHYSIGACLAVIFVLLASTSWLQRPTLLPAVLFGIVTTLMPIFVMQPSFGLGIGGSKTPHPARVRLKSLMTHTVFGVGLYLAASVLRHVVSGA